MAKKPVILSAAMVLICLFVFRSSDPGHVELSQPPAVETPPPEQSSKPDPTPKPDPTVTPTPEPEKQEIEKLTQDEYTLEDNDLLYADDDDLSVVTMYLTVTTGNESENTNHTWKEVNTYSVYDYERMGVERYAVNGLLQVGDENGPLEGQLGYGIQAPNATVNIRGQTSSRNPQKNYKIRLMDDHGLWNEQQTINLNKHQWDPTRFKNKLCFDLLEELPGTISLQTQFVHLYVRDLTAGGKGVFEDYGLYTQVEQLNRRGLMRHGLDRYGQLYKANFFEFFRYEDVIQLKTSPTYDETKFNELLEIKGSDDHSKLIQMLEDVNDPNLPTDVILDRWFDLDNMTSWMAFHILMGNVDTQSRNVFLYSPLNGEKFYFISWDNDGAFWRTYLNYRGMDPEMSWEIGICNYWGNLLFRRALTSETYRKALDEKIELFRSLITKEKIANMARNYASVVKPYLYGPTDRYLAPLTAVEYDQLCQLLPNEMEMNYRYYQDSFLKPMPFFISMPEAEDGKLKFIWENSYVFSDENVLYSFELANNLEFKDPIVSEQNIFVPGYTYEKPLAPGQYFIRVRAVNEAGKTQNAFDYYVDRNGNQHGSVLCFYVLEDGSISGGAAQ